MGSYVPNTKKQQEEMLHLINVKNVRELYENVPEEVFLKEPLNLPQGLSEFEVRRKMSGIAEKNKIFHTIFRGAGAYRHYIPSIEVN